MSLLLPPSWANVNCTGSYQGASRHLFPAEEALTTASISKAAVHQAQITADIHVTTDHPVYIDRPWTLQYGGCGVPGKKISIPISFLTTGVLGPQGELKGMQWGFVFFWIFYSDTSHSHLKQQHGVLNSQNKNGLSYLHFAAIFHSMFLLFIPTLCGVWYLLHDQCKYSSYTIYQQRRTSNSYQILAKKWFTMATVIAQ